MRVFVSSTVYDLEDVRAEVKSLLEDLGLQPALSDWLDSGFDSTVPGHKIKVCLENVRRSDVFLMILSQRYGSPCEDMREISMIHREYQEAKKLRKRIIGFCRQGLREDYFKWKNDEDTPLDKYRYIQSGQDKWNHGLFRMIDECSEESNGVTIENWWNVFTHSTDLKRSLAAILEKESGLAKMRKLIESGNLPFFSANLLLHQGRTKNNRQIHLRLEASNVGKRPAINVSFGGDIKALLGQTHELGVVSPGNPINQTVVFARERQEASLKMTGSCPLNFFNEYQTYEQLTIREKFRTTCSYIENTLIVGRAKLVEKELIEHDGWKITSSAGSLDAV